MLITIPDVLTPAQVVAARELLASADWVDGKVTAGHQSAKTKDNQQIPEDHPVSREVGEMILRALGQNALFLSAALPLRIFPPLFNRYSGGQNFGTHVDNAIRQYPGTGARIRTDLSATLFFEDPENYDGGELCVEDTYGVHRVKLPAGSMVLYPSTSLHHVTPVTRGTRMCSFFWLQSMIRDDGRRSLLLDLDVGIQRLGNELSGNEVAEKTAVQLTGVYHNLLRQWAEM
ncbi:MAG: Fe2+-dependent dioxygenase [Verrucomicrobiales bacterium]|jgi:PKHD-type hydroxylase|nr:Fe2+-dependent dioxygenase [Verrucomicrobiales bacterium]HQZ28227.1 Fe2+-dependent dioxygenase [Verrucomicrobiales bacterium]